MLDVVVLVLWVVCFKFVERLGVVLDWECSDFVVCGGGYGWGFVVLGNGF